MTCQPNSFLLFTAFLLAQVGIFFKILGSNLQETQWAQRILISSLSPLLLMLKMDENVNLRLEQHFNCALFYCLRLYSWHRFVDF